MQNTFISILYVDAIHIFYSQCAFTCCVHPCLVEQWPRRHA